MSWRAMRATRMRLALHPGHSHAAGAVGAATGSPLRE